MDAPISRSGVTTRFIGRLWIVPSPVSVADTEDPANWPRRSLIVVPELPTSIVRPGTPQAPTAALFRRIWESKGKPEGPTPSTFTLELRVRTPKDSIAARELA